MAEVNTNNKKTRVKESQSNRLKERYLVRLFMDKRFAYYTWIGIFISVLNIFLLWLLIDVFKIPTIIASTLVIGATFLLRYILLVFFKIF